MFLTWFTPMVLMCAFEPKEIHHCDEHTEHALVLQIAPIQKIKVLQGQPDEQDIEIPITTPMLCLAAGTQRLAEELETFQKANRNKDIEFRIICRHEKT